MGLIYLSKWLLYVVLLALNRNKKTLVIVSFSGVLS